MTMHDKKIVSDNVYMFVPNIIGYIRIALLIVAFKYAQDNYVFAVSCYLTSAFLDELDGKLARALGQTSLYGQQLDEITDEVATMGIASVLCHFYPQYIWFFQLLIGIDIAGHWAHMHNSAVAGNKSHKTGHTNPVLRVYWTNQILTPMWVYGNHLFLAMLYLCYFTEGPALSLLGSSVGLFKLIAYMTAPWSISRGLINGLMMVEAFKSFARIDISHRRMQQRIPNETCEQNDHSMANGHVEPVGDGVNVTGDIRHRSQ